MEHVGARCFHCQRCRKNMKQITSMNSPIQSNFYICLTCELFFILRLSFDLRIRKEMLATGDEKTLFNGDLNGFVNNEARHKTWTRQLEMRFFYDFGLSISKVRVVLFMISSIYAKLQCPSLGKVMVSKLSNLLAFLPSLILGAVVAMECHGSIAIPSDFDDQIGHQFGTGSGTGSAIFSTYLDPQSHKKLS